jgi:hypothetical protein
MSFLSIRSRFKKSAKRTAALRAPWISSTQPSPVASQQPQLPSAISSESFESPFVVEISPDSAAASSSALAIDSLRPTESPHVDLQLSNEPLFPSGFFSLPETTLDGSPSLARQQQPWNPYAPKPGSTPEEIVVVAGDDATDNVRSLLYSSPPISRLDRQDDPAAWIDEPSVREYLSLLSF